MINNCVDVYMTKSEFKIFEEQYKDYITRSVTEKWVNSYILIKFHYNEGKNNV